MNVALTNQGLSIDQASTSKPRRRKLVAEWVPRADRVRVIACRDDGAVMLVNRYLESDPFETWRLPGAWVEDGETAHEAAIFGLHAETGLRAARWFWSGTTPGSEMIRYPVHHFQARSVRFDPDPETIDVHALSQWFDLDEAAQMALDGLVEPLSALQILRAANQT